MPAIQVVTTAIELAVNQALDWSPNKVQVLKPLADKTCIIFVQEFQQALIFNFSKSNIYIKADVDSQFKSNPEDATPSLLATDECWVSLSIFAIDKLKQNSQMTKLIKSGQLDFAGDLSILQALSKLFDQLELDIEEILSHYLGDVAAYNLNQAGQKVVSDLAQQAELLKHTFADAALDEKKVAVRGILVANFCDQVNELKSGYDRAEARLTLLEEKLSELKTPTINKSSHNKSRN